MRFWSFLLSGQDPISEIIERFDVDELYDEDRTAPGKVYVREGGFIPGVEAAGGLWGLNGRAAYPYHQLLYIYLIVALLVEDEEDDDDDDPACC